MSVFYRYKKLQKCIKYPNGTIIPVVPNEFKRGDLISMDSYEDLEECLYNYQYRWYRLEVIESDANTYICEGYSQYYKEIYQQSTDGEHWTDVVPRQERKGDLINEYSESCGYVPLIEWRIIEVDLSNPNTYVCYLGDLYLEEAEYISYDNGKTYVPTGQYRRGTLFESNSELCIYSLEGTIYDANKKEVIDVWINDEYKENNISFFNPKQWEEENSVTITDITLDGLSDIRFNNFKPSCHITFGTNIKSFDFNGFDTSNMTDMSRMFYCEDITEFDLRTFDTSKVTNMSSMFNIPSASVAQKINLSGLDASNVTTMEKMFNASSSVTNIDFTNFKTLNVENMARMFQDCYDLIALDLSSFNTSKVTNMSQMFQNCYALTSLDLSSFDTSNVTVMSWMFNNCRSLTSLDLSSFDTSNVTAMNDMFYRCESLENLDLSSFDTSNVDDMYTMFYSCKKLKNIDVSHFNTSKVTNMSGMFALCESLETLNISNFDFRKVTTRDIFGDADYLTNLKTIKANNIYLIEGGYLFRNISANEIDLIGCHTEHVTNMSYLFSGCKNITYLDLSSFDISNVTTMHNMFYACKSLNHIKCKQSFKDWCITNQSTISLPTQMREGGSGTWEIVG